MDVTAEVQWIDNHCHLKDDAALSEVLAAASLAGVTQMITVGTDAASSAAGVALQHVKNRYGQLLGFTPMMLLKALTVCFR